jgi:transposase
METHDGVPRRRGPYTEEFRRDAADLVLSSGRPTVEVARELGINDTTLGNWVRAERDRGGIGKGTAVKDEPGQSPEEENKRLRKRVAELEKEREILKRFAAFWVKETNG